MRPEPVTDRTPRTVAPTLLSQNWRDVLFLHWPVHPAAVAPLLPAGVFPDVRNGTTWVGLVAFAMERLGPGRTPLPYFGTFPEVNVRLYSVDPQGRRAVVFRSLDCPRLPAVLVARSALGLPYRWSRTRWTTDGPALHLATRVRGPGGDAARCVLRARVGPRLERPGPLAEFLTARWGLHTRTVGRTVHLPVEHPPWPLHLATVEHLDETLVRAAGLEVSGPPPSVLFSPGVPVRFGPWSPVSDPLGHLR
ncbi:YqjF family protein [Kitasatospora sp. NPDC088391]|uniref:YqjF family protein n=1 Tax=Kitasatospora sp. NPDC088391 TaxID=3364074 RepID=UPI00381DAE50